MSNKIDLHVEEVAHKPYEGFNFELLSLKATGKDSNIKLMNSFRRACSDNIPKYAFPRELIKITKNTTVAYNNDYMTLRLSHLPVFNVKGHNIDPDIDYLHERYWQDVDFLDRNRIVPDEEKNIEIQINVHNNSDVIKYIKTDDPGFKVYIDNEKVDMYSKEYPILIIKLRPNDSFSCSMKAVLGLGERHTIWSACSNSWHHYENDDPTKGIIVNLRSSGMLNAYDIALRACSYLHKKIEINKKEVLRQFDKNNISAGVFEIELKNEDHTLAELINYELQSHKNICYAGVAKPDHLIRSMLIKLETKNISQKELRTTLEECFKAASDKVMFLRMKIDDIASGGKKKSKSKISRVKSRSDKHKYSGSEKSKKKKGKVKKTKIKKTKKKSSS